MALFSMSTSSLAFHAGVFRGVVFPSIPTGGGGGWDSPKTTCVGSYMFIKGFVFYRLSHDNHLVQADREVSTTYCRSSDFIRQCRPLSMPAMLWIETHWSLATRTMLHLVLLSKSTPSSDEDQQYAVESSPWTTDEQVTATSARILFKGVSSSAVILILDIEEFSGAQQNLFCPCRIGPKLVISRGLWKLSFHLCGIGTNFYFSNVPTRPRRTVSSEYD